jgi:hypothetical protein
VGKAPSAPDLSGPPTLVPVPQPVQTTATGETQARPGCLGHLKRWKWRIAAVLKCLTVS